MKRQTCLLLPLLITVALSMNAKFAFSGDTNQVFLSQQGSAMQKWGLRSLSMRNAVIDSKLRTLEEEASQLAATQSSTNGRLKEVRDEMAELRLVKADLLNLIATKTDTATEDTELSRLQSLGTRSLVRMLSATEFKIELQSLDLDRATRAGNTNSADAIQDTLRELQARKAKLERLLASRENGDSR